MDNYIRGTIPIQMVGLVWQDDSYTTEHGHPVIIKQCEQCGRLFYVLEGREYKPIQYCSVACKQRSYRKRKAQAKKGETLSNEEI